MKNLFKPLLLCGLLFLCSCSVLKKSKESHTSASAELQQGSQSTNSSVDSSKKVTTEHWKITVPGSFFIKAGDLPKFEPLPVIDLAGATKEQAAAFSDLQGKYNKLVSAYNDRGNMLDQSEAFGQGLLIELDRHITDNTAKSSTGTQQDSLKVKTANQDDKKEMEKQVNWTRLIIGIVGLVIALFVIARFLKPQNW